MFLSIGLSWFEIWLLPFCISGPEPHERADEEEDEFDMVAKGAVVGLSSIFLDPLVQCHILMKKILFEIDIVWSDQLDYDLFRLKSVDFLGLVANLTAI